MKHIGNIYSADFKKKHDKALFDQANSIEFPKSVIEMGTYLPLKQQVEMFKASGINLSALRQATYDFANGVADWRIEEYMDKPEFLDSLDADVATMLTKKMEVLSRLQLEKERSDAISAEQAKIKEEQAEVAKKEAFERWYKSYQASQTSQEVSPVETTGTTDSE